MLSDVDVRILGSLIEKQFTTPEYYPLSLNALVTACNQTTNRDPVVNFDEATVERSLTALRQQGLIRATKGVDARVTKYGHRVADVMGLGSREIAVLGVLLLRGPQTTGELRTRASRFEPLPELADVEAILDVLMAREFAVALPRQPGHKELRYAHVLAGAEHAAALGMAPSSANPPANTDRLSQLEQEVSALRQELNELRAELTAFRAQF